jgi:uncharacterized membrane protein YphA (DoxX/SURF4 family)
MDATTASPPRRSIKDALARSLPEAARVLLGLIFFVFGLNGFLHFLPQPPPPAAIVPFVEGLTSTGYFMPVLKGVEVLAGLLLLSNRFVPLALTVLAPIVVQIALFHVLLAPALPMVVVLLALELYLAWTHRSAFAPMLAAKHRPSSQLAAEA